MNERMLEVMRRRSELQARIAAQRVQIAEAGVRWQPVLALADRGIAAAGFLRSHPALVGGVAALMLIRRRGVTGLLRMGWRVWKGYRYLAAFSARLNHRVSGRGRES